MIPSPRKRGEGGPKDRMRGGTEISGKELEMRTKDLPSFARAQSLRADMTEPESKLWTALRNRRLAGAKFIRQAPIGPYFADFLRREAKLIVEADGGQHADNAYDEKRDVYLVAQGYAALRVWNAEVMASMRDVCETILAALEGRLEPYERYRVPSSKVSAAPHPALRATFSPLAGRRV